MGVPDGLPGTTGDSPDCVVRQWLDMDLRRGSVIGGGPEGFGLRDLEVGAEGWGLPVS